MSSGLDSLWETTFLRESPGKREVLVGVFGKHPISDDHIEDPPNEYLLPAALAPIAESFDRGVIQNGGAWAALPEAERLWGFNHWLFWKAGKANFVAIVASSMDGSISFRKVKPLVICARCTGLPCGWILEAILPKLAAFHQRLAPPVPAEDVRQVDTNRFVLAADGKVQCYPLARNTFGTATVSRLEVQEAFTGLQADLTRMVRGLPQDIFVSGPGEGDWERFFALPDWGMDHERLGLGLEAIEQRAREAPAGAGKGRPIRVPVGRLSPEQALFIWAAICGPWWAAVESRSLVMPLEEGWLDIQTGDVLGPEQFFYWRASARHLAPLSGLSTRLSTEGVQRLRNLLLALNPAKRKPPPLPPLPPAPPAQAVPVQSGASPQPPPVPGSQRVQVFSSRKWLLASGVVVALVLGVLAFWPQPSRFREKRVASVASNPLDDRRPSGSNVQSGIASRGLQDEVANTGKTSSVPVTGVTIPPADSAQPQVPAVEALSTNLRVLAGEKVSFLLAGTGELSSNVTFEVERLPVRGSLEVVGPVALGGGRATARASYLARPEAAGDDVFTFRVRRGEQQSQPALVTIQVQSNKPPRILGLPEEAVVLELAQGTNLAFEVADEERPQDVQTRVSSPIASQLRAEVRLEDRAGGKWWLNLTALATNGPEPGVVTIEADDQVWKAHAAVRVLIRERPKLPPLLTGLPADIELPLQRQTNLLFSVGFADQRPVRDEPVVVRADSRFRLVQTAVSGSEARRTLTLSAGEVAGEDAVTILAVREGLMAKAELKVRILNPAICADGQTLEVVAVGLKLSWMPGFPGGGKWGGGAVPGVWIGQHEITQGQYRSLMSVNPSCQATNGDRDLPVENVTWEEARAFCERLNQVTKVSGWRFDLPDHSQSEALLKACWPAEGQTTWGRFQNNRVVGQPLPMSEYRRQHSNSLYDVLGNVSEWVWEAGRTGGVARGGGVNLTGFRERQEAVNYEVERKRIPEGRAGWLGFRVVLAPVGPQ